MTGRRSAASQPSHHRAKTADNLRKIPVIWPNEPTSATSSGAGKTFSPVLATSASLSSARFALSAFFFLNSRSRFDLQLLSEAQVWNLGL